MSRNQLATKVLISAGAVALMGSAVGTLGPKDNIFTKIFANPAAVLAAAVLSGLGTYAAERSSSEDSIAPGIRLAQPTFVPPQPQTYAYNHPAIAQSHQPLQPLGAAAPSSTILHPAQPQLPAQHQQSAPPPAANSDGVRGGAGWGGAHPPSPAHADLPADRSSSEWQIPDTVPAAFAIGKNAPGPVDSEISEDLWGNGAGSGDAAWGGQHGR